ncbi:MAG TPA: twin-arginine translocase subunit TatC [Candidatus Saccharimonadales bacterium]|nr:twin-arginine translocase subunit TatC [Candidatus Saccharimonadales bacterium]
MATTSQKFHDHIKELRNRFAIVFLSVAVSTGITYILHERIIKALQHPLGAPLFYSSPAGSFNFILQLSMLIGMFIALPVIVFNLLRFIEPALPINISTKNFIMVITASYIMALIGLAFSFFYLLPMSLHFFSGYASAEIKPLISASEYLSFVTGHLITFALMFQIPLVILFINWIKPIKPGKLLSYQRHVVVGSFGLAVVLPFTYDPISQFIVAVPIVALFYLSVVLLWIANRRPKKAKPKFEIRTVHNLPTPKPVDAVPTVAVRPPTPRPARLVPVMSANRIVRTPQTINQRALPKRIERAPTSRPAQPKPTYRKLSSRPLSIDGVSFI